MSSPKKQYISEIRGSFDLTPTWLPSITVEPGDIVLLDDDSPTRIDNLRKPAHGVKFDISEDATTGDIHYMSAEGVSVTFKAAGSIPIANSALTSADAGVSIEFLRKNAALLEALGCKTKRISDQITLGRQILELYRADKWEKEWAVVTEVVYAESLSVFLSSASEAKIELKAEGNFNAGAATLASASANFAIVMSRNMATQLVAAKNLTPFYKAYGIRGLFGKTWGRRATDLTGDEPLAELRRRHRAGATFGPAEG